METVCLLFLSDPSDFTKNPLIEADWYDETCIWLVIMKNIIHLKLEVTYCLVKTSQRLAVSILIL